MTHLTDYFSHVSHIAQNVDLDQISHLVKELVALKERKGRLFLMGVGGSAANCSHAVNDFRKLCQIEAYAPTDNVSELTARTNDDGWDTTFTKWLEVSCLNQNDALFIMSVGGGDRVNNISTNIVNAIDYAKNLGAKTFGIVGPHGGYTKQFGDCVVVIPVSLSNCITPLAESFQAVVWHSLVSHPSLQTKVAKWESVAENLLPLH